MKGSSSSQSEELTGADHSYEFSVLVERFDQRLDEGRLRYGLGAREATWDNDGVVFSLERITTSRSSRVTSDMSRKEEGYVRHWTR
jgi:hypothetical protein